MTAKEWFFSKSGVSSGPVSGDDILILFNNGSLFATDLVWKTGLKEWKSVNEAFSLGVETPPPLPNNGSRKEPSISSIVEIEDRSAPYRNLGQSIDACFTGFFKFSGRASRSEYWWFYGFQVAVTIVLALMSGIATNSSQGQRETLQGFSAMIFLAFFFPNLSVTVRRFHDLNLSGWWVGAFYGYMLFFLLAIVSPSLNSLRNPNLILLPLSLLLALVLIGKFAVTIIRGKRTANKYQEL